MFAAAMLAMILFIAGDLGLAASYSGDTFLGRLVRKVPAEQYLQLVSLPLFGAITGGLISTAFAIFVDHPPWKHDSKTYVAWLLILIALFVIVAGPLWVSALITNPKNLDIGHRIDRLKAGDWARDNKDDVIETIERQRAAITDQRNNKGKLFRVFLILAVASAAGSLIFAYVHAGVSRGVIATLLIAAVIVCALAARYWVRPAALRGALKDRDAYWAEADKLSPPAPTAHPSPASAAPHHDLWIAAGGLVVGAILAGLGAVRGRGERQG
jgi:hypothetical protein